MRIGLTLTEYFSLVLTPAGPEEAFRQAAEMERKSLFPMTTAAAAAHLRSRGYDALRQSLELLVENGVVRLTQPDVWLESDVEAAANHFEQAQILVPFAAACQTLGCSYADFLRPLREAAEDASRKYGRSVAANDQYFVLHREPPRGETDDAGNLIAIKPARITFSLCNDIRERLERGEEV